MGSYTSPMKYAKCIDTGERIEALKNTDAICEICTEKLIAKCGEIMVHHWSHASSSDCDSWYEPETVWHREMKNYFPKQNQEITMQNHRADVKTDTGVVVEFQNSSISTEEIKEREAFYGRMVWLINGDEFKNNFCYVNLSQAKIERSFCVDYQWQHFRKSWLASNRPIFIDNLLNGFYYNEELFEDDSIAYIKPTIRPMHNGWLCFIKKRTFIDFVNGNLSVDFLNSTSNYLTLPDIKKLDAVNWGEYGN